MWAPPSVDRARLDRRASAVSAWLDDTLPSEDRSSTPPPSRHGQGRDLVDGSTRHGDAAAPHIDAPSAVIPTVTVADDTDDVILRRLIFGKPPPPAAAPSTSPAAAVPTEAARRVAEHLTAWLMRAAEIASGDKMAGNAAHSKGDWLAAWQHYKRGLRLLEAALQRAQDWLRYAGEAAYDTSEPLQAAREACGATAGVLLLNGATALFQHADRTARGTQQRIVLFRRVACWCDRALAQPQRDHGMKASFRKGRALVELQEWSAAERCFMDVLRILRDEADVGVAGRDDVAGEAARLLDRVRSSIAAQERRDAKLGRSLFSGASQ